MVAEEIPTREQDEFAERVAAAYGRSGVERLGVGPVVRVYALLDDIVMADFYVGTDGKETLESPYVLCKGCGRPTRRENLYPYGRCEPCSEHGRDFQGGADDVV